MTPISALFRHELRLLLRDTRMILIAVVLPLVLFPVLILVLRAVEREEATRLEEATYRVAVEGPDEGSGGAGEVGDSGALERLVARALALPASEALPDVRFERVQPDVPEDRLAEGDLHVVVGLDTPDGTRERSTSVILRYRAESDFSRAAVSALEARLLEVGRGMRDSAFVAAGYEGDPSAILEVVPRNVATAEREGSAFLGLLLTPLVLLLLLTGGSIAAVDTLSGEKERGTLETLLTTALARRDIIRAKLAAIVTLGLVVVGMNALNLALYLGLGVLELPDGMALSLSLADAALVLVVLTPLTVLVGSALLLLSGRVDGYKDFQIAFFPVLLAFVALAVPGALPGMELRSAIALVPVAGIGVAVREILMGQRDWLFLALAWASTGGLAVALTSTAERVLRTERLVAGTHLEERDITGGPELFAYRFPRWFAGAWALFFTISLWFGDALGVRGQVVVNLLVIFGGVSWILIRRYRLDARRVLSLYRPHPAAWLAVLLGAPAGYVTAIGLAGLVDAYLIPTPQSMLEAFGDALLLETLPLWQLVVLLALAPAVFEEIAFRGVLLHGLRARLRPVAACLLAGAVFGVFHVSLFRIVPTAYLGVLLAATVLLTGSLYPAVLWHFLNNALAVVPASLGWIDASTEPPIWIYPVAALALGVSLSVLWRTRRRQLPLSTRVEVEGRAT